MIRYKDMSLTKWMKHKRSPYNGSIICNSYWYEYNHRYNHFNSCCKSELVKKLRGNRIARSIKKISALSEAFRSPLRSSKQMALANQCFWHKRYQKYIDKIAEFDHPVKPRKEEGEKKIKKKNKNKRFQHTVKTTQPSRFPPACIKTARQKLLTARRNTIWTPTNCCFLFLLARGLKRKDKRENRWQQMHPGRLEENIFIP